MNNNDNNIVFNNVNQNVNTVPVSNQGVVGSQVNMNNVVGNVNQNVNTVPVSNQGMVGSQVNMNNVVGNVNQNVNTVPVSNQGVVGSQVNMNNAVGNVNQNVNTVPVSNQGMVGSQVNMNHTVDNVNQNVNTVPVSNQGMVGSQVNMNNVVGNVNQNVNSVDGNLKGTPSKKKSKLLIVILILVLLLGVMYIFYQFYLMNEKTIVKGEVKKVFGFVNEKINQMEKNTFHFDVDKEPLGVEGKISLSSNYKSEEIDLSKLSDYHIVYNGAINKNGNKLSGSVILNKGSEKVISSDMYMYGKEVLVKLNELFDKTLKITSSSELKDIETTKSLNYDDVKTILNKTEKITLNSIDKGNVSKKLVQKEINHKKDYYMEVTYDLNTNQYAIDLIDGYLKDEKIIAILADLSNMKTDEIKDMLSDSKKYYEDSQDQSNHINFVFYVDKLMGSFQEVDIISNEKNFRGKEIENKFVVYQNNDVYFYEVSNDGKKVMDGTYDISKKEVTVNMKEEGSSVIIIVAEENNNTYKVDFKANVEDLYSLSMLAKINNKITSTSQTTDTNVVIQIKYEDQDINAEINNSLTIFKDKKPVEISANDSVSVDSLTEADMEQIQMKAMTIMESVLKDFVSDTSMLFHSEQDNTYDNYGLDY